MTRFLDTAYLAGLLKAKRGDQGLRETAQAMRGVSSATLSRIENGAMPDMETFLLLCDWLHMSPEEVIIDTSDKKRTTLERIEKTLQSDPSLSSIQVEELVLFLRMD